jgi:hypothetical protein
MRALGALTLAACSATQTPAAHVKQAAPAAPAAQAAPPTPAPSCPRLARAPRTWTGFAVDVPGRSMYIALDALVPIQEALGALFCGPEREPCRPAALLSVELADESARAARVELDVGEAGAPRALSLRALGESWEVEPESLAAFMAACLGAPPR